MGSEDDIDRLLGDPKAAIRRMMVPFLIAIAVVEINQFVDTFWVSGLGSRSAEALAVVVPIYGLIMWTGVGLSAGSTATIAYRIGKGNLDIAGRLVASSLVIGLIVSVIVSAGVYVLLDPLISFMGAEDVHDEAVQYMMPYLFLSPALLLVSIVGGTLRGEGAARKATAVQISCALINIVLDPIMIYTLGLGLFGAALATAVASAIATMIGLIWYFRGRTAVRLDAGCFTDLKRSMKEMLGVGGPKTIQFAISNITDYIQRIFIIMAGGTSAVMLYNFPWRYVSVAMLPSRSLEMSTLPVCSASFGQNDMAKMRAGFLYSVKIALIASIAIAAFLMLFSEQLMSIMAYEETMKPFLPKLAWTLRFAVIMLPFIALMGAGSSLLQSMKKAKIPMYYTMVWGVVKLALYALAATGLLGVDPFDGIIYMMVFVYSLGGVVLFSLAVWEFRKISRYCPE